MARRGSMDHNGFASRAHRGARERIKSKAAKMSFMAATPDDIDPSQRDVRFVPKSDIAAYSITSSAVANRCGGIARFSALADLMFMIRSDLVGCTTGSSASFAPLRIRPQ